MMHKTQLIIHVNLAAVPMIVVPKMKFIFVFTLKQENAARTRKMLTIFKSMGVFSVIIVSDKTH